MWGNLQKSEKLDTPCAKCCVWGVAGISPGIWTQTQFLSRSEFPHVQENLKFFDWPLKTFVWFWKHNKGRHGSRNYFDSLVWKPWEGEQNSAAVSLRVVWSPSVEFRNLAGAQTDANWPSRIWTRWSWWRRQRSRSSRLAAQRTLRATSTTSRAASRCSRPCRSPARRARRQRNRTMTMMWVPVTWTKVGSHGGPSPSGCQPQITGCGCVLYSVPVRRPARTLKTSFVLSRANEKTNLIIWIFFLWDNLESIKRATIIVLDRDCAMRYATVVLDFSWQLSAQHDAKACDEIENVNKFSFHVFSCCRTRFSRTFLRATIAWIRASSSLTRPRWTWTKNTWRFPATWWTTWASSTPTVQTDSSSSVNIHCTKHAIESHLVSSSGTFTLKCQHQAQFTLDTSTLIYRQFLRCCLRPVWTIPFATAESICVDWA